MRVYHLLSRKHATDDLSRGRLKVAEFEDLNDPFELLGVELADRGARRRFAAWRKRAVSQYGVLCFSKSWRNPVLWSHYADRHRGVCLGFEVPDALLRPVTYLKARASLGGLLSAAHEGQAAPLFEMKFEHWQYEDEVRRIIVLREAVSEDTWHFWPFGQDLQLKEVIAGARCAVTEAELRDSLGDRARDVNITKARLAFRKFEIVTQQRGFHDLRSRNNRPKRAGSTPAAQPARSVAKE